MGKISDKNTRTLITIPKELKTELEEIAKNQNRSFNNLIITILKDYINSFCASKRPEKAASNSSDKGPTLGKRPL